MLTVRRGVAIANAAIVGLAITAVTLAARNSRQPTAADAAGKRIVSATQAFLETLTPAQRSKANIDLNAKTRTVWSNLPTGIAMQVGAKERNGLKIGDMTPAQEKAAMALLAAALS